MKKLFLYLTLSVLIFIIAFYIGKNLYNDRPDRQNVQETGDVSDEISDDTHKSTSDELPDAVSEDTAVELPDETSFESHAAQAHDTDTEASDYYVVTMSQGYVIVKTSDDMIYDYTDIETGLLPEDTVNNLQRGIYFYDLMKMYNYLESLSS